MKRPALCEMQKVRRVLQGSAGFFLFIYKTEELLDIVVAQGRGKRVLHLVIGKIALKLIEIQGTPGAEIGRAAAPGEKFPGSIGKWPGTFQRLHIQMQDFLCAKVERCVDLGPDFHRKAAHLPVLAVELYGSDLQNLKRKLLYLFFFPVWALIPF